MMAEKEKEQTAEQKLLKMIEANDGAKSDDGAAVSPRESGQSNFLQLIKTINKFLLVGIIASIVFLIFAIQTGVSDLSREVEIGLDSERSLNNNQIASSIVEFNRLAVYIAPLKKRNVFEPFTIKKKVVASEESDRADEINDKYRLVGIAWFDTADSASVMIEDKDQKVTYFLQKGESLENIKVKTIYAESALLGYENEEIIIRYDTRQP